MDKYEQAKYWLDVGRQVLADKDTRVAIIKELDEQDEAEIIHSQEPRYEQQEITQRPN